MAPIMPIFHTNMDQTILTIGIEHVDKGEHICLDLETYKKEDNSPFSLEDIRRCNGLYLELLVTHNVI